MLAKSLFQKIQEDGNPCLAFFCKRGVTAREKMQWILASFIFPLIRGRPDLQQYIMTNILQQQEKKWGQRPKETLVKTDSKPGTKMPRKLESNEKPEVDRKTEGSIMSETLNFDDLWKMFAYLLGRTDFQHHTFIIDALDECELGSQTQFITRLNTWGHACRSKLIITVRPTIYSRMLKQVFDMTFEVVESETSPEDVNTFLNAGLRCMESLVYSPKEC